MPSHQSKPSEFHELKTKSLALFFTGGVSLKIWDDVGMFEREISIYNRLSPFFKKIYLFSYGTKSDCRYADKLANNVLIIPRSIFLPKRLYSLFMPFVHCDLLKRTDIFKTNQMLGSWTAVIAKLIFRKKLVVRTGYVLSINNSKDKNINKTLVYLIEKFAYTFADSVITTSKEALSYIKHKYKPKTPYIHVIPNYIDTKLFFCGEESSKLPGSICFVGRLSREKNLLALLSSLANLPYQLTIIGGGELLDDLEMLSDKLSLKTVFLGNVPNSQLPDLLNRHEIFILPSLYEGLPKVLLEAMACGLPVIGSNVNGIKEIIKDGHNGSLCKPNVESIREQIISLMENPRKRVTLGKNARKTIEDFYSLDKVLTQELSLYKKLLKAEG